MRRKFYYRLFWFLFILICLELYGCQFHSQASCSQTIQQLESQQQVKLAKLQQQILSQQQQIVKLKQQNTQLASAIEQTYWQKFNFSPQTYTILVNNLTFGNFLPHWLESGARSELAKLLVANVVNQSDYRLGVWYLGWLLLAYQVLPFLLFTLISLALIYLVYHYAARAWLHHWYAQYQQLRRLKLLTRLAREVYQQQFSAKLNLTEEIEQLEQEQQKLSHLLSADVIAERKRIFNECEEMLLHARKQGYALVKQAQRDARQIRAEANQQEEELAKLLVFRSTLQVLLSYLERQGFSRQQIAEILQQQGSLAPAINELFKIT